MNHIYRLVFNSATGLCQVVSELGSKSQGSGAGAGAVQPRQSGLALACLLALATASGSVLAAPGGAGGVYTPSNTPGLFGGAGGATGTAGQAGGQTGNDGLGGTAGVGPGGNGGIGSQGSSDGSGGGGGGASGTAALPSGGNGGNGGTPFDIPSFAGGGGGGGGGDGYVSSSDTINTVVANGGNGGSGFGGGGGGNGLTITASDRTVTNTATGSLRGGAGGFGNGAGGIAGAGGAGLAGSDLNVVNDGRIVGGYGGTAPGTSGAGGAGITGATHVINSGSISGGYSNFAGASAVLANAIEFTGTANTLELRKGSTITGNVMGAAGASNTLALGGTVDDSFDTSQIGSAAQYRNFTDFQKIGTNTYTLTGTTTAVTPWSVLGGTLAISSDDNLGAASGPLTLNGGTLQSTTTNLTLARAVTLGAAGGTVNTDAATITEMTGVISGAGALTKTGGGVLILKGANTYSGATHIVKGTLATNGANTLSAASAHTVDSGASLVIDGDQTIGSLAGAGSVALQASRLTTGGDGTNTTFSGVIVGKELDKTGTGTFTLSGANTYDGDTLVSEGTLQAAAANTFSAASAHEVASGATLDTGGFNQTVAALANNGTVSLVGSTPGSTLTVTGPYVGLNGVLRLGTVLGDSTGASDRLVLSGPGAVAIGHTALQIVNQQGLGALTAGDGITVVSALNGATTTAQTTKDAFSLAGGHVDAGAYEYRLYAADASGAGENWYLRSSLAPTPPPVTPGNPGNPSTPGNPGNPGTPGTPSTPGNPSTPGTPGNPGTPGKPAGQIPTYRTEVPLLAAVPEQLRQGNLTMLGNLHQRFGSNATEEQSTAKGATAHDARRAWGRAVGTELNIAQSGTVKQTSDGHLSGFQVGSDLFANDNWQAGVYVGELKGSLDVKGFARGVDNLSVGHNDLTSQYLGGYATWTDASGVYIDSVLQNGRHQYKAHSEGQKISGKADSWLASVEVGKAFALGGPWRVEPQLQLVQQHLSVEDEHLGNTQVRQDGHQGLLARLGARLEGDFATEVGLVQPYTRVNLYRAANGNDKTRFETSQASTAISSSTGGTSTELAGGVTVQLNPSTDVYAELGKQWAAGGDTDVSSSVQGSMGVRVKW